MSGATTFTVVNPDEFDADGGQLQIGSEIVTYSIDTTTGDVTLKTPLANDYLEGEPVYVYPPYIERLAYVKEPGSGEELEARVPHGLYDRLPTGTRDDDSAELVDFGLQGNEAVVADVIGREPDVDSAFLNTQQDSSPATAGATLTGSYVALDGAVTITPEKDILALVMWGTAIRFPGSANAIANASLFLDGVQIGVERTCASEGASTAITFPISGETAVSLTAGEEHTLEMRVEKASGTGTLTVPAGKNGGISYVVFGG